VHKAQLEETGRLQKQQADDAARAQKKQFDGFLLKQKEQTQLIMDHLNKINQAPTQRYQNNKSALEAKERELKKREDTLMGKEAAMAEKEKEMQQQTKKLEQALIFQEVALIEKKKKMALEAQNQLRTDSPQHGDAASKKDAPQALPHD
jgi:hypothetical protein